MQTWLGLAVGARFRAGNPAYRYSHYIAPIPSEACSPLGCVIVSVPGHFVRALSTIAGPSATAARRAAGRRVRRAVFWLEQLRVSPDKLTNRSRGAFRYPKTLKQFKKAFVGL